MATEEKTKGKLDARNPYVRLAERDVVPIATPRRGSLFIKRLLMKLLLVVSMVSLCFCIGWGMVLVGSLLNIRDEVNNISILCLVAVGSILLISQRERISFGIFSACLLVFIIFCLIMVVCAMMLLIEVGNLVTITVFGIIVTTWFVLIIPFVRNKKVVPAIWVTIACIVPILLTLYLKYLKNCWESQLVAAQIPGLPLRGTPSGTPASPCGTAQQGRKSRPAIKQHIQETKCQL